MFFNVNRLIFSTFPLAVISACCGRPLTDQHNISSNLHPAGFCVKQTKTEQLNIHVLQSDRGH